MWANSKKHAAHPSLWWGRGCPMAWRSSSLLPQKASAGLLRNLEQQQAALWYGKAADELYQTCYKISIPPNLLIQTSSVRNTSSHSLLSSHCVSALKRRKYNYVITLEIKRADESMCTSQQSWTKILHKVLSKDFSWALLDIFLPLTGMEYQFPITFACMTNDLMNFGSLMSRKTIAKE